MNKFVLTRSDASWPASLVPELEIDKLYGIGDPSVLSTPSISIIGARRGSPYGTSVAKLVAEIAAEHGITVTSGGALGVDVAAARGALSKGGKTIVVTGGGADVLYPSSSSDVYHAACEGAGAVISLFPFGTEPFRWTFPRRNKVIAALSQVLVVTEASIPSGTFSTADTALSLGKRIYAAPGSIFSPYSKGTNKLIEEGAQPLVDIPGIECALAQEFGFLAREQLDVKTPDRGVLLKALFSEPLRPDDLARLLDKDVFAVLKDLSAYEIEGLIERLPDGRFSPTEKAFLIST